MRKVGAYGHANTSRVSSRSGPSTRRLRILGATLGIFVSCWYSAPALARPGAEDAGHTKAAETQATEVKPTDTKPTDTKPTDTKPADTKPADTKPADTKPGEANGAKSAKEPLDTNELGPGGGPSRGLSWDVVAGGVPEGATIFEGNIGFSGLPRLAFHQSLSPELSLGGQVAFDFAYWAPSRAFTSALLFQAPIRMVLYRANAMNVGLRLEPGLGFSFEDQLRVAILGNVGASVGFKIEDQVILGGGVDVPFAIWLPTGGTDLYLSLPILLGPVVEYHVTPPLALTFDFKIGPHINSSFGTVFGLRMMAGVAYRL